jgi:hypothetical protein
MSTAVSVASAGVLRNPVFTIDSPITISSAAFERLAEKHITRANITDNGNLNIKLLPRLLLMDF